MLCPVGHGRDLGVLARSLLSLRCAEVSRVTPNFAEAELKEASLSSQKPQWGHFVSNNAHGQSKRHTPPCHLVMNVF